MQRMFVSLKFPGRETAHLPYSAFEIMNAWSCATTSLCIFMAQSLINNTDVLTLTTPNIEFNSNYFEEIDTFHNII